jgi:Response regulators consisting of a CheY-like receiver domain and a winged-helix DNA-binding domain
VRLPRASAKPAARKPARRSRAGALDGLRVLCIEDEAEVRESMLALMTRWGCDVRGAADRAGAEAAFDGAAPDMVVLDYRLEDGETGPAVYAALCARWGETPPGLLVTAERGQDAADAAAQAGLAMVQKPVPPAALRASLSALKRRAGAP